jgi:hypothetical protein
LSSTTPVPPAALVVCRRPNALICDNDARPGLTGPYAGGINTVRSHPVAAAGADRVGPECRAGQPAAHARELSDDRSSAAGDLSDDRLRAAVGDNDPGRVFDAPAWSVDNATIDDDGVLDVGYHNPH